jgi:UDP-2,3-diacylglucosamine hydrolase
MHGDELCTDDLQYQAFRQQVRSTQWQSAFLQASKEERRAVAKQLRNDSQSAQSEKSNEIMDANTQAITQAFTHSCCQTLIHGHTHRPNKHHYYIDNKEVTRLVLGDWGHQGKPEGWHLRISHEGALLESFPLS